MTAAHQTSRAVTPRAENASAPAALATPPAALGRVVAPALARRLRQRIGNEWLPRATWTIGRTGRAGLAGIAFLLAAAVFLFSTYLPAAAEVEALRAELATAPAEAPAPVADEAPGPAAAARPLPARTEMPAILRQLFDQAAQARLAIDIGKYEIKETKGGDVIRTHVTFPVAGPYPRVRAFIDTTLTAMPAVALGDLVLERKSIADGNVEAQIRLTIFTVAAASPGVAFAVVSPDRVVMPTHAAALFAQHSWTVLRPLPKLPPPPPPPPPPEPTAPPLPFRFVGSYTSEGAASVYFLARGDQMIDARVGDRLDGVYQLESAAGGRLVFIYLPLNIRQSIEAGASK